MAGNGWPWVVAIGFGLLALLLPADFPAITTAAAMIAAGSLVYGLIGLAKS